MTKTCANCELNKSLDDFGLSKGTKDGRQPWCRECFRTYQRNRRQGVAHERKRWGHRQSPEARQEYERQYQLRHRGRLDADRKARQQANPDLHAARSKVRFAHRRAQRHGVVDTLTVEQWMDKIAEYDGICAYCDEPFAELDHVVSMQNGGANSIDNVVPACLTCNRTKRSQVWTPRSPS